MGKGGLLLSKGKKGETFIEGVFKRISKNIEKKNVLLFLKTEENILKFQGRRGQKIVTEEFRICRKFAVV